MKLEMIPPPLPKGRAFTVEDEELYPLTRAYPVATEQPPPLPGLRAGIMARVETTFIVREEWLSPITGKVLKSETITAQDSPVELASPQFDPDIALRIKRVADK